MLPTARIRSKTHPCGVFWDRHLERKERERVQKEREREGLSAVRAAVFQDDVELAKLSRSGRYYSEGLRGGP